MSIVHISPTNHQTREIAPGIVLDARRAVWLEESRSLLVADLHLGFAWAQRSSGNLVPLGRQADGLGRLIDLLEVYTPTQMVLLGDIVHDAVDAGPLASELKRLHAEVASRTQLVLIGGNHDRRLGAFLRTLDLPMEVKREIQVGPHRLVHGDGVSLPTARAELATAHERGGYVFCGHEHPAITLSDQVASFAKCPCFVEGPGLLMLPAFSEWAAGNNVRRGDFLSPYLQAAHVRKVIPIIAGKLLEMPVTGNGPIRTGDPIGE